MYIDRLIVYYNICLMVLYKSEHELINIDINITLFQSYIYVLLQYYSSLK